MKSLNAAMKRRTGASCLQAPARIRLNARCVCEMKSIEAAGFGGVSSKLPLVGVSSTLTLTLSLEAIVRAAPASPTLLARQFLYNIKPWFALQSHH